LEDELQGVEQHELQVLGAVTDRAGLQEVDRGLALVRGRPAGQCREVELVGDRAGIARSGEDALNGRAGGLGRVEIGTAALIAWASCGATSLNWSGSIGGGTPSPGMTRSSDGTFARATPLGWTEVTLSPATR